MITRNKILNAATLAGNFGEVEIAFSFENGAVYRVYVDGIAYGTDASKSFSDLIALVKNKIKFHG